MATAINALAPALMRGEGARKTGKTEMQLRIKANATLKGMDRKWTVAQQGAWADKAAAQIVARMEQVGARCARDEWDGLTVSRVDGRGLRQACKAAVREATGIYGEVWG